MGSHSDVLTMDRRSDPSPLRTNQTKKRLRDIISDIIQTDDVGVNGAAAAFSALSSSAWSRNPSEPETAFTTFFLLSWRADVTSSQVSSPAGAA